MKKIFGIVLAALLFGVLAGGTILGVQYVGNKFSGNESVAEIPTEAASVTQAAVPEAKITKSAKVFSEENTGNTIERAEPLPDTAYVAIDVSGIVEASMPEVVAITNTTIIKQMGYGSIYDYFYGNGTVTEKKQTASASGVIISETDDELLIVTNNHVVENASELAVTFIDGETVNALLKGSDPEIDIAVIAIPLTDIKDETKKEIKVATLHTEDDLKCGQGVIAIGNALGYGQSVTVGVISALNREITDGYSKYSDLIQTDAAINPGNSGGALLNNNGELIAINVAKFAQTEVEGVGFSIPIYKAIEVIENLSFAKTKIEIPEEKQGRLGVYMNTITAQQSAALNIPAGVMIVGFSDELMDGYGEDAIEDSPARKAGLQKNDILTKFDGQTVTNAQALANLVKYYEAGTKVDVTVQRINNGEYEEKTFTVTLGTKKAEEKKEEGKTEEETKPEETEAPKESESQEESTEDMYDLFRKFLEQYR
ncbi:MAG: trypsin-like peptidase domain-containing protein [Lachnospiraceae bacterium]|nr:trypsin-like peptidase domain-containing protein [Lachnospiraceae bacterium]